MKWDLLCCYEIVAPFKQGLTWAIFKIHVVVVCGSYMEKLNMVVCYTQFFDEQIFSPCYRRFMDNKWKIQRKMKAKAIVCFLHVWGFILPIVLLKKKYTFVCNAHYLHTRLSQPNLLYARPPILSRFAFLCKTTDRIVTGDRDLTLQLH